MSLIQGFDQAQAKYENAHPDDNLCPCEIAHEIADHVGYDLEMDYVCDHEDCHGEENWFRARYFIAEGFIENETQLVFVIGLLEDMPKASKEIVAAAMKGLDDVLEMQKGEIMSKHTPGPHCNDGCNSEGHFYPSDMDIYSEFIFNSRFEIACSRCGKKPFPHIGYDSGCPGGPAGGLHVRTTSKKLRGAEAIAKAGKS